MRTFFPVLILFYSTLFLTQGFSQPVPRDTFTTREARTRFLDNLISNTIEAPLHDSLTSATESLWSGAFWGAELIQYKDTIIQSALYRGLAQYQMNSVDFNRSLLQGAYSLSQCEFSEQIKSVLAAESNPKNFAMAAVYLKRCGALPETSLTTLISERFPQWEQNPVLLGLHWFLQDQKTTLPPLKSLFNHQPLMNKILIISFQRKNRDFPGMVIFRSRNGNLLRNESGRLTGVPQLARAACNLPSFLTNGNTPQGLFHIAGVVVSKNRFIGKTPALNLELPFEATTARFLDNGSMKESFNRSHYVSMLPKEWHNYPPVFEALNAGEAGRYDIMAHGTTVDHIFYEGKPYSGFTPSMGCMVASEYWNSETGERLESGQENILQAYKKAGGGKGYYLLLEIDDKQAPVTIEEVEKLLEGIQ